MNILLIKASCLTSCHETITHPLGLLYLASYLRLKEPDKHNIKLIDKRVTPLSDEELKGMLKEFKPEIVGISALTREANIIGTISEIVKEVSPETKIIAGGPHATSFPDKILNDFKVNYVVIGEGEATFYDLVKSIDNDKPIKDVKGVAFKENEKIVYTERREFIENLDIVPNPDWDLLDIDLYKDFKSFTPLGNRKYMAIFTSRGCPYGCIYCHNIFGKSYRARTPENIFAEISELINKYGITDFDIIDDSFNLNAKRVETLCDMIINSKYKIGLCFPNGLRSDLLNEHIIKKMYLAGTKYISFAIESGSEKIQKLMKKNLNLEKAEKSIEFAVSNGIFSNGFFMIGFPNETEEDINKTINFALKSKLHLANFFSVTPFQGTELFNEYCSKKQKPEDDFINYNYHKNSFNLSNVPLEKLESLKSKAYMRFYLNPVRIVRIISRFIALGSPKSLLHYFDVFFKCTVKSPKINTKG